MINTLKKMPQRVATSLLLFFLIIGFSGYHIGQAQAASELATPLTSLCDITRDLKLGMVGNDVKELQKYLNNNGFPLAQNGIGSKGKETTFFGTLTRDALVKLRKDNKIPAIIGVFDSATRDFLGCEKEKKIVLEIKIPLCNITRDLKLGMVGNDVKELQKYLNNNGFPLAQNGIGSKGKETNNFVTLTKNALTKFQKDNKIPATIGVFDLATRDFLGCGNKTEITPIISYILTYTAGAGGTISGDASQTVKTGGNGLSVRATPKSGYYFTKWSDGVTKNPRTDMNVTADKTVTAHFSYRYFGGGGGGGSSPSITTYIVTFDANGSTGGTVPANQTKTHDITLSLATNSGTLVKTGYTFAGWNTLANGSGTTYTVGSNYTANAGVTLFAKWTAIPFVCGDNVSFTYNDSSVIYGTVLNTTTGKCWLDRNLGATQVATSSTDNLAFGDLFQWGRPADGHQLVDRITTGLPVYGTQSPQITTITPGTSNFIIPSEDWSSSDSDGASRSAYFAKTDGTGICPTGFRVPTASEINAEILSWSSNNSTGAFTSPLKLPVTGGRVFSNGSLYDVWVNGYYWSTTVDTTSSRFLRFGGDTYLGNTHRAYGLAIRCIFEEMSDTYTVTFDTNGGDGGSTAPQTLNYNTPTTLTANGFTRNGYTFAGWATTAGGAVAYADQASYTIAAGNATLYAKWTIAAPTSLSYTPSNLFVINQAISTLSPTVTGTVDSYSISPDLPAGLSLNTSNGQITGTPTVSTNSTTYTITATNAGGFTTFDTLVMVDGTVTGADGRIWLDRNLGATRVATSSDDYQSYGSLFQWGRASDGHQLINHTTATAATAVNGNTSTLATSDTPGDNLFIKQPSSPYDWRNPANNNLWQGVNGTNNVCPAGFRLPTSTEWSTLVSSAGITNYTTAYSSSLKLTAAGYRNNSNASLFNLGTNGYYWSSSVSGDFAYDLYFYSSGLDPANNGIRALGFSVRCIKDVATYTVTFNINGGDGGSTTPQTLNYNIPTTLTANGFTRDGYTFAGWATTAGGAVAYADQASYTIAAGNATLYAKWTINTYTVTFDGNTSTSGSTAVQTLNYNTPTALTANGFTKTGYTFAGWATSSDGVVAYANEASYTIGAGNVILYAKWIVTPFACGDNVSFTYNGSPVTYGTVSNATTGKCWLDRNLGATQVASSSTDSAAYGHLFQWGRPADGHQLRTSGTQSGWVATITPGTNTFIIDFSDWSSIDSNGALRSAYLAKTDGTGICPAGFRVPTETEINTERLSWSTSDIAGAFGSPLKLTATGNRYLFGGVSGGGDRGDYWSSTVIAAKSRGFYFHTSGFLMQDQDRANGFAVRCILN